MKSTVSGLLLSVLFSLFTFFLSSYFYSKTKATVQMTKNHTSKNQPTSLFLLLILIVSFFSLPRLFPFPVSSFFSFSLLFFLSFLIFFLLPPFFFLSFSFFLPKTSSWPAKKFIKAKSSSCPLFSSGYLT